MKMHIKNKKITICLLAIIAALVIALIIFAVISMISTEPGDGDDTQGVLSGEDDAPNTTLPEETDDPNVTFPEQLEPIDPALIESLSIGMTYNQIFTVLGGRGELIERDDGGIGYYFESYEYKLTNDKLLCVVMYGEDDGFTRYLEFFCVNDPSLRPPEPCGPIDPALVELISVGMTYEQVVDALGGHPEIVGSGIQWYQYKLTNGKALHLTTTYATDGEEIVDKFFIVDRPWRGP